MLFLICDRLADLTFTQTYADAQADTVPPYWETTVHAPGGVEGGDFLVDDLPTGTVFVFAANLFISFFFQFIGFLMTYLLHTSHAAKFGSRAGLGLTLIQYGFYSRTQRSGMGNNPEDVSDGIGWSPEEPQTSEPPLLSTAPVPTPTDSSDFVHPDLAVLGISSKEWLSFLLMTIGMQICFMSNSTLLIFI